VKVETADEMVSPSLRGASVCGYLLSDMADYLPCSPTGTFFMAFHNECSQRSLTTHHILFYTKFSYKILHATC